MVVVVDIVIFCLSRLAQLGRGPGHLVETSKDLSSSVDHTGSVVSHTVLLAKRSNSWLDLGKVVARHRGEQVVLNLVVESTSEPVGKQTRVHITASDDLLSEKVHVDSLLLGDDGHTVVVQREDQGQQVTADSLRDQEVDNDVDGVLDEQEHGGKVPGPVHGQRQLLNKRDRNTGTGGLVGLAVGHHKHDRLQAPGQTGKGQDGEVKPGLVQNHESAPHLGQLLIGHIREHFQSVLAPGQQRVSIDIGILAVDVGGSVMSVVLVLPPRRGETLADTSQEGTEQVAPETVLEDLVVQKVVGEPAALLPEETQDGGRDNVGKGGGLTPLGNNECRESPEAEVEGDLEGVVGLGGVVVSKGLEQGAQLADLSSKVVVLDGAVMLGNVSNIEVGQCLPSSLGVESVKDIYGGSRGYAIWLA